MRHRIVCAAMILLASSVAPLAAQVPDSSRVRVSTRGGTQWTGILLSTRPDTLRMRPEGSGDALAIPVDSIRSLKVSEGMQRHVRKDVLVGAGIGMVVGGVLAAASYQKCTGSWCIYDYGPGGDAVFGGALGLFVGGTIGAVTGSIKREEWRSVPLPQRRSASVMPMLTGGRVGLVGSVRF